MKKLLMIVLMVSVFGLIFGAGTNETKVLKLGHIQSTEHPTHQGALLFAELVEEATEGRIKVNVFPNSQLGGIQEMFSQVQTGDLSMVYGGINTLAFISGGEAFEITAIPFLYRDYEHMRAAMKADFFKPILEDAEAKTGVKVLNIAGDTAPRGLSANRAIRTPADFKGLKIRTAASEVVLRVMQKLGALPQQIAFADLYMALQTGVVDAQETGALTVADRSFYEVQDYYMQTDYIRDIETFYINPALWNGLSESDKTVLLEASEKAGELVTELVVAQIKKAYELLESEMTIIREPELDLPAIRAAIDGVFADWDGSKWPAGTLDKIRSM